MGSAEKYMIDKDIRVACVTATSFPQGIGAAWQKLFSILPPQPQRTMYGISYGGENGITYKAGAEELQEGEAAELDLETFLIRKGEYISELLKDWRKDETQVGKTFHKLLEDPRIDKKEGYCLEIYTNPTDVLCLVKLA